MPDTFADLSWAPSNLRAAGIVSLYAKLPTDVAYYNLGIQQHGVLDFNPMSGPDVLLRPITRGHSINLRAMMLQAKKTEFLLLDELLNNQPVSIAAELTDGRWFVSSDAGARFIIHGAPDLTDFRRIELIFGIAVQESEVNALLQASSPSLGTPTPTDLLYTLTQSQVRSDVMGGGLIRVDIRALGESVYQNFGDFRDGRYTIECLGPEGGGGRLIPRTHTIRFVIDIEGLQTAKTELDHIPDYGTKFIDCRLVHMDNLMLVLPGLRVGTTAQFFNEGMVDTHRSLRLHIEGSITIPFTAWDSYWS